MRKKIPITQSRRTRTLNILKAVGVKSVSNKSIRRISPALKKHLQNMKELKQNQSGMNTNTKAVMEQYQYNKQQQIIQKALMDKQLSPNTRIMLQQIMSIQNKSQSDDSIQQRRLRERRIVGAAMDLMKTPYIFNRYQFNSTGVEEDNILLAPNTFKEIPGNRIMKTNRPNILQTKEGGNDLGFV